MVPSGLAGEVGSLAGCERLDPCDCPSEDQSMDVMSAWARQMQSWFGVLTAYNFPLKSIFMSPHRLLLWKKNRPTKTANADSCQESPLSDSHQGKAQRPPFWPCRENCFSEFCNASWQKPTDQPTQSSLCQAQNCSESSPHHGPIFGAPRFTRPQPHTVD